jgi:hypothetical protein
MSFNSLLEYTTGFAMRRFMYHDKVLKNPNIVYEQAHLHALICMINMKKAHLDRSNNLNILTFVSHIPVVKNILPTIMNNLHLSIIDGIAGMMKTLFNIDFISFIKSITSTGATSNIISDMIMHPVWRDILDCTYNIEIEEPITVTLFSTHVPLIT